MLVCTQYAASSPAAQQAVKVAHADVPVAWNCLPLWLTIPCTASACVQIIVRKVYHLLAGALFVPAFFWDLPLLCLSLAIAFAALVLLEVLRRLELPRLGAAVQRFMQVSSSMCSLRNALPR